MKTLVLVLSLCLSSLLTVPCAAQDATDDPAILDECRSVFPADAFEIRQATLKALTTMDDYDAALNMFVTNLKYFPGHASVANCIDAALVAKTRTQATNGLYTALDATEVIRALSLAMRDVEIRDLRKRNQKLLELGTGALNEYDKLLAYVEGLNARPKEASRWRTFFSSFATNFAQIQAAQQSRQINCWALSSPSGGNMVSTNIECR